MSASAWLNHHFSPSVTRSAFSGRAGCKKKGAASRPFLCTQALSTLFAGSRPLGHHHCAITHGQALAGLGIHANGAGLVAVTPFHVVADDFVALTQPDLVTWLLAHALA